MVKRERVSKSRDDDPMELLKEIELGLQIDKHALDESLMQQPDLFYRVSKTLALLTSRRDAMKQELQTVEADVELEIREEHRRKEDKVTDKAVAAELRTDPKVKDVLNELLELNRQVGQFGALKEAFTQRSYVLKDLVSLHIANYYSDKTDGGSTNRAREVRSQQYREERSRRDRE